jgi:HSP90 family molecular chaperone
MIEDLAEKDKEKFATFWNEFGRVLKEGMGEDHGNRERIAKVCASLPAYGYEAQEVRSRITLRA